MLGDGTLLNDAGTQSVRVILPTVHGRPQQLQCRPKVQYVPAVMEGHDPAERVLVVSSSDLVFWPLGFSRRVVPLLLPMRARFGNLA